MKKLNKKGFTLIELLAVITIMTILMLVAIPAVSRTIENTRRDSFANLAKNYLNAVRNAVIADELECQIGSGTTKTSVAAVPIGTYYYAINSSSDDLMESGGKSSWNSAEVNGYIKFVKSVSGNDQEKIAYSVALVDTGSHGIATEVSELSITRSNVKTAAGVSTVAVPTGGTVCTLK